MLVQAFIVAMLCMATEARKYKPVSDEVRFSGGDSGISASINDRAIDYLKMGGLPYLYNIINELQIGNQSFEKGPLKFDLDNIKISIPMPQQEFIRNWDTQLKPET